MDLQRNAVFKQTTMGELTDVKHINQRCLWVFVGFYIVITFQDGRYDFQKMLEETPWKQRIGKPKNVSACWYSKESNILYVMNFCFIHYIF